MPARLRSRRKADPDEAEPLDQSWAKEAKRTRRRVRADRVRRELPGFLLSVLEILELFGH